MVMYWVTQQPDNHKNLILITYLSPSCQHTRTLKLYEAMGLLLLQWEARRLHEFISIQEMSNPLRPNKQNNKMKSMFGMVQKIPLLLLRKGL